MVYEAGEKIEGFTSADGETLRVGQQVHVVDPDKRKVRTGYVLYRRAIGAVVFVDGIQWHSRLGIYAKRENATSAARDAAKASRA